MPAYNTSSAYDLSVYEGLPKSRKKPELKVVEKRSAKRTLSAAFTPKVLGSFAIVVTLICLMVYNQVCLTEINEEINQLQKGLGELESEYTKISSEMESLISLRAVEERAKEMGMQRRDKYQTEPIYLYEGDKITISENAPDAGLGENAKLKVRSILDGLKEYIGND